MTNRATIAFRITVISLTRQQTRARERFCNFTTTAVGKTTNGLLAATEKQLCTYNNKYTRTLMIVLLGNDLTLTTSLVRTYVKSMTMFGLLRLVFSWMVWKAELIFKSSCPMWTLCSESGFAANLVPAAQGEEPFLLVLLWFPCVVSHGMIVLSMLISFSKIARAFDILVVLVAKLVEKISE